MQAKTPAKPLRFDSRLHHLLQILPGTAVPCCFPRCNSVTSPFIDGDQDTPLSRIGNADDYLDYITIA